MGLSALGFDWNDQTTSHLYVGLLPLALLALTLARSPRALLRDGAAFPLGFAFALFYMLGAYTPVFRAMYELLPGVDLYRRPNDAAFLFNAMLAILTGAAAHAWMTAPPAAPARLRTLLAISLPAAVAVAAGLWLGRRLGHADDMARALSVALPLFAAAVVFLSWRPARVWVPALLMLTAADLGLHGISRTLNAVPSEAIAAYRPEGRRLGEAIRARLDADPDRPRAEIFGLDQVPGGDRGGSWQNAAMVYGIEQTLGYDPLRSALYTDWSARARTATCRSGR